MRAQKTLQLPNVNSLRGNSVQDIRDYLRRLQEELCRQWRLLWQDVHIIQVDEDGWIYFGNMKTDGTWRIGRSGNDYNEERRENGKWVTKSGSIA